MAALILDENPFLCLPVAMDEKSSREAAISAKIAAIRAANEERERRHAEVEADKKLAEKKQSAINLKLAVGGGDASPGWDRDRNFTSENSRRSPMDRCDPSRPRTSAQDRLRRDESGQLLKSRLGDKDGPPPDPAYRLARSPFNICSR
jgi:hypothetical protein